MVYGMLHKDHAHKLKLERSEEIEYYNSCLLVWVIQTILSVLVGVRFLSPTAVIYMNPWYVTYVRLFATFLLHMQLQGETAQAASMLLYYIKFHDNFFHKGQVAAVPLMQMSMVIVVEVICILEVCVSSTVIAVLFNFIALGIIAQIDDIYTSSLGSNKLNDHFSDDDIHFKRDPSAHPRDSKCVDAMFKFGIFLLKWFYQAIYFYFFPFMVVVFTFAWGVTTKEEGALGVEYRTYTFNSSCQAALIPL